jgi:PPOX class probable F420-dependent enzyme
LTVSRRDQIQMTAAEQAAFLSEQRTVICATNGVGGWPHLMPLWYVVRGEDTWAWTYSKSQKVRNLERDPRATLQVEAGEEYDQLRGIMIEARTEIHRDTDLVAALGSELAQRYGGGSLAPEARDAIRAQAAKRVALQFVAQRTATWDHRKLAGAY